MERATTIRMALAALLFSGLALNTTAQNKEGSSVNIGLVYPMSTNGFRAPKCSNVLSLNAIAGISRVETGAAIAGFANFIQDSASGAQIAGFMNIIRNRASGVQIAGFMNKSGDANVQVAGFLNVARKVRGIQLAGFLNIADSSDYPIGIINIIRSGEKSIAVSFDETQTVLLSLRTGGRVLYGIIGAGYNDRMQGTQSMQLKNGTLKAAVAEAGIGAHLNFTENFRVNLELATITATDFEHGDNQRDIFRLLPSLHSRHFELFAGPTFNYVSSEKGIGANLIKNYSWSRNVGVRNFQALYIGYVGGIAYKF
jgi:hypothetical protein